MKLIKFKKYEHLFLRMSKFILKKKLFFIFSQILTEVATLTLYYLFF